jgi:hypothetical protein
MEYEGINILFDRKEEGNDGKYWRPAEISRS